MNFDRLNNWLTLVANLAVVVGIFALIAEINHSTRVAEVGAFVQRSSAVEESARDTALSEEMASMLLKYSDGGIESLTPLELLRIRSWETARIYRMNAMYYQYERGLLEKDEIDNLLASIRDRWGDVWKDLDLYDNPRTFNPSFKAAIEDIVSGR